MAASPVCRPVPEQIIEAIEKHQDDEHVILLITHEGMMSADLDNLAGWHVKIDEMPLAVVTDKMRVRGWGGLLRADATILILFQAPSGRSSRSGMMRQEHGQFCVMISCRHW